jgi:hypothetical protein
MISIASRTGGVMPLEIARLRPSGCRRSALVVGASRSASLRRRRRWPTPRNEIVS